VFKKFKESKLNCNGCRIKLNGDNLNNIRHETNKTFKEREQAMSERQN
jgi:hypothetical protein